MAKSAPRPGLLARNRTQYLCIYTCSILLTNNRRTTGPLTALAYVLIIGTPTRFQRGKQIGTYVGMIPCEESGARKQRLGHISKQGNSLLRFLLVEAAQAAARNHPD